MEILILTTFVSVLLAALGALFFAWSARAGTLDHADRLALLPLERDGAAPDAPSGSETP